MKWWIFIALFAVYNAKIININTKGIFTKCSDTCYISNDSKVVKWGTSTEDNLLSGLEFMDANASMTLPDGKTNTDEYIGSLIHNNYPINGVVPKTVSLNLTIIVENNTIAIPFELGVNETDNQRLHESPCPYANASEWFGLFNQSSSICCPYYTPLYPCSDRIYFITPFNLEYSFTIGVSEYTLYISGFEQNESTPNLPSIIVDKFITQEYKSTIGNIYAKLIVLCAEEAHCNTSQCVIGECDEGYCKYNETALNGTPCNYTNNINVNITCYEPYCSNGECILSDYLCNGDGDTNDGDINDGSEYSNDDSIATSEDNSSVNLLPLLSLLALCCFLIPLLLCLLLLPALIISIPIVILTGGVLSSDVVEGITSPIYGAENNPTYVSTMEDHVNPIFDFQSRKNYMIES